MRRNDRRLEKELNALALFFPKLRPIFNQVNKLIAFEGEIDISDFEGVYYETFEIRVELPANYPKGVPKLFELSHIIPRADEFHISEKGECCVDFTHELIRASISGLRALDFLQKWVYPYLANQVIKKKNGSYAGGEYKHYDQGILQYYDEQYNLKSKESVMRFLELIMKNKIPLARSQCPCGSGKVFKGCHMEVVNFLKDNISRSILRIEYAQLKFGDKADMR